MSGASTQTRKLALIDLAHQPDFALGRLTIKPSTREVVRPDGVREVLEPRVMQVLVALYQASPEVLSRDDLIAQCWEGRIVGDDAMNGAIKKLRRLSGTGQAPFFSIETIPRVGYRLVAPGQAEHAGVADKSGGHPGVGNRRVLLAGGVLFSTAALAGGGWWFAARQSTAPAQPNVPPAVVALIARGNTLLRQGRIENQSEAAGLFQEAIDLAPENAEAWAGLAVADAFIAHNGTKATYQAAQMRALSAIDRALALDPRNASAWMAKWVSYPARGAFFESEQALRQGLAFHPEVDHLWLGLADYLKCVGRMREAATAIKHAMALVSGHIDPAISWISIASFTGAGQLKEADQAAARGMALFPRHPLTWLHRIYLLMFTGRAAEALITLRDIDNRPPDQHDDDINGMIFVAEALNSGAPRDIDKAAAAQLVLAKKGERAAENAFMFLASLGKLDEAFAIAQSCYVGAAANTPPVRFAPNLFEPGCRAMRKDPRFATLMDQMGLTPYWRKAGVKPDYQIYPDG
ncbi:MAG TPA: winged helix-turn-helix domain-containing protein [Rhizomicrobium sp.]|jgi:DNA-binding winged helix-turn-helix (wHTH) protein/tetratricopeptide (TPR) repeat protein